MEKENNETARGKQDKMNKLATRLLGLFMLGIKKVRFNVTHTDMSIVFQENTAGFLLTSSPVFLADMCRLLEEIGE